MLAETVSGLLVNLLSSATDRGLGAFYKGERHKAALKRIVLGAAPAADSTVTRAISTLVQVIGSGTGQYTTVVHSVITNFSASQLPPTLLMSLRTGGKHTDIIKSEFISTYGKQLSDSNIAAEALFDAICEAIKSVIFSTYEDPNLAMLSVEHQNEILEKLDAIAASLKSTAKDTIESEEIDRTSMQVCKGIVASNKTIGVETSRGQKRVAISTHFIKSRLRRMTADDFFNDVVASHEDPNNSIPYGTFASSFHRAVVLGTPGGGKSTLCQYICHDAAQRYLLSQKHPERTDLDLSLSRIPLVIVLRRFEKYTQDSSGNIIEFLAEDISNYVDDNRENIQKWIRHVLSNGSALVLFDGLDEILDVSSRRRYVRLVESFSDSWPAAPILSTSRKVGYTKAPLTDDFQTFELAPFNSVEIVSYATKLIALEKTIPKDRALKLAREFHGQTDSNASDLRRNPLMLGLMVWLFCVQGEVPSHRAEIYKQCSDLMFERWDKNRGIRAEIPDDFDLVAFFSFLASKIFGKASLEDGVTDDWLETSSFQFFRNWYEENAKAKSAAKVMREFITGRAWVMTDVGAGIYKFTHRTFLEYFFSRHLLSLHDTAKSLISALRTKILNAQWDVINHLCIQAFCYKDLRKSSQVANLLIEVLDSAAGERRENCSSFIARSLEYLVLSEADTRRIATKMIDAVFSMNDAAHRRGALLSIDHSFGVNSSRRPIVIEEVQRSAKRIAEAFGRGDDQDMETLLIFLGQASEGFLGIPEISGLGKKVREDIASSLLPQILLFGRTSLPRAELAVTASAAVYDQLYEAHGDGLLLSSSRPGLHGLAMPLLVEALLVNGRSMSGDRGQLLTRLADWFMLRVRHSEPELLLPRNLLLSRSFNRSSIVHQFGTRTLGNKSLPWPDLLFILCFELKYFAKDSSQQIVPVAARKRLRVTPEISAKRRRNSMLELWRSGELSLVKLV